MALRQLKTKKCAVCKTDYSPYSSIQRVCSQSCAMEFVKLKKEQKHKRGTRKMRMEFLANDRPYQKRLASTACHKYIVLRDKLLPCIGCGSYDAGRWNAGHYRSRKAQPEIQFHHFNIHKECVACNNYLSGNLIKYRENLITRIGPGAVDWLEGYHAPYKYSIDDFKQIREWFDYLRKAL